MDDNSTVYERYYNLSLKYLSYRQRSEKEIVDYLGEKQRRAKNLTDEIIAEIILKLREYKFIDDRQFAKSWIRQRTEIGNKPSRVIEFELRQKGISQDIIDECLSRENTKESDLESAKKLTTKKMDFYRGLPPDKRREKVMNYLLRKGFNYETVRKAVGD